MRKDDFEAFKQAWLNVPSQDNEGYVPDRGGFKVGWFAALNYERKRNLNKAIDLLRSKEAEEFDPSYLERPYENWTAASWANWLENKLKEIE